MYKFFVVLTFILCQNYLFSEDFHSYLPKSSPESHGFRANFFNKLGSQANKQIPSLGSFLVWKHDALIYEGYFHGCSRSSFFDVKSVTKSVLSAIIGAAKFRGYLPNLDTLVVNFFPEYQRKYPRNKGFDTELWEDSDSALLKLTFSHLLTMQTGFDFVENSSVSNAYSNSSDQVKFTLELPFSYDPGEKFNYCSPAAHLAAAILTKLLNSDVRHFADSIIFKPAGIILHKWPVDAMGRYLGASGMEFTAQDMIKFGVLYLNNGKIIDKQIITKEWVKVSTSKQVELKYWDVLPGADGYGYYWWRRIKNGHQMYIASGYGGQLICIIPDLDMVVTTTCTLGNNNRGRSELKRLHLLINKIINAAK